MAVRKFGIFFNAIDLKRQDERPLTQNARMSNCHAITMTKHQTQVYSVIRAISQLLDFLQKRYRDHDRSYFRSGTGLSCQAGQVRLFQNRF